MDSTEREEIETMLRRIVRQEVRAAIAALVPADAELMTLREVAEWMNTHRPGKAPLKTRAIRTMVEMGMWRAVRLGGKLLVPRRELQLMADWQRHTWREREDDRLAWEEEERKRRAQRWKRKPEREG